MGICWKYTLFFAPSFPAPVDSCFSEMLVTTKTRHCKFVTNDCDHLQMVQTSSIQIMKAVTLFCTSCNMTPWERLSAVLQSIQSKELIHTQLRESKLTDQDLTTKLLLAKLNFKFFDCETGKNWHLGRFPFPLCSFQVNEYVWRIKKDTYRLMQT